MTEPFIQALSEQPNLEAEKRYLADHVDWLRGPAGAEVADALKKRADGFLRSDSRRSLETSELLVYLGQITGEPCHSALGLLAEANTRCIGGLGEFERAVELYDEAAAVYAANGRPAEEARSQIGKVWALANLARYQDAIGTGTWAAGVLEEHGVSRPLADLIVNLGILHGRVGEDAAALARFDRAIALYRQIDCELPWVPMVEQDRSITLRNLGRFEESIRASQSCHRMLTEIGQTAEAARAQQNLAMTYFVLGRYNEALELLDSVRQVFLDDGRQRDAILVDLYTSDCLLQLRRFADVLAICRRIRAQFSAMGTPFEVAQARLNEAVAHAGLFQHDSALGSLAEARAIFQEQGNDVWVACSDLERAALLHRREQFAEARSVAQAVAAVFAEHGLPVREAQAQLVAAQASVALHSNEAAQRLAGRVHRLAEGQDIPSLAYQAHHLLGSLAREGGDARKATAEYDLAIHELERLRGRMMVEHRVDFLEDKGIIYQEMVRLLLDGREPGRALDYAERAKSRALLDLLAYRVDLGLHAREATDRPLVDELMALRARRDVAYRRWESREGGREEGWDPSDEGRRQTRQEMLTLEKEITERWHRLLVRNADYARDAALWQVRSEPILPYLPTDTLLIEFFTALEQVIIFLVSAGGVEARALEASPGEIERLVQLFWLNVRSVPGSSQEQMAALAGNARGLLERLFVQVLAPVADTLEGYDNLIVVPHGALHYIPFAALGNGDGPLLARHTVSTLPGASLLRHCSAATTATDGALVMGHSWEGRLPNAVEEARAVARLLGTEARVEGEATVARLRAEAPGCRTVHLAAHGEFRPDNPLFSGLALDDGWLATLDLFGLRLDASLVTLSACETGRSVVGGGDELLGLLRALLYAGAASVVMSLWTVEDESAAGLMEAFYGGLAEGLGKAAALREAQLALRHEAPYAHPYFWAGYCLVGDGGSL